MAQTPNQNMPLYSCAIEFEIRNDRQPFTKWKGTLKGREKEGERDSCKDVRGRRLRKLIHTWEISAVL